VHRLPAVAETMSRWAGRAISVVLFTDAVLFVNVPLAGAGLDAASALGDGVDRCRYRLLVAAVVTGRRAHLLLGTHRHAAGGSYPGSVRRLEFLEFVVGNVGIEIAALYPVVSLRLRPRPGSVTLVFAITAAYPGFVGWFAARELSEVTVAVPVGCPAGRGQRDRRRHFACAGPRERAGGSVGAVHRRPDRARHHLPPSAPGRALLTHTQPERPPGGASLDLGPLAEPGELPSPP
jgi:hypothetical protein